MSGHHRHDRAKSLGHPPSAIETTRPDIWRTKVTDGPWGGGGDVVEKVKDDFYVLFSKPGGNLS